MVHPEDEKDSKGMQAMKSVGFIHSGKIFASLYIFLSCITHKTSYQAL